MAALFIENYRGLRTAVPILPDLMAEPERVVGMLSGLAEVCPGVVAMEDGRVLGYMGWYLVDHFRETERKAAFCPEWAHGAVEDAKPRVYRALYRAAAESWTENACQVHGLTLLAYDQQAEKIWFWNGFGLTVVDAIRPTEPLGETLPGDVHVRKAAVDDLKLVETLEREHWAHYSAPPVLMQASHPDDAEALAALLAEPQNSIWLAMGKHEAMGYMRFEVNNSDCAAIVEAPDRVSNTAAYVRPQYRGRKAAAAMLDAALRDYAAQGFARCSVDFESFNPEAASFWMKYFEPVAYSVLRVPERDTGSVR